jgi:hypothetical protein
MRLFGPSGAGSQSLQQLVVDAVESAVARAQRQGRWTAIYSDPKA